MNPLVITASADNILPATRLNKLLNVGLCAAAADATIEIFDGTQAAGKSIAKLAAKAGTNANNLDIDDGILMRSGLSATITGVGAQGYIYFE